MGEINPVRLQRCKRKTAWPVGRQTGSYLNRKLRASATVASSSSPQPHGELNALKGWSVGGTTTEPWAWQPEVASSASFFSKMGCSLPGCLDKRLVLAFCLITREAHTVCTCGRLTSESPAQTRVQMATPAAWFDPCFPKYGCCWLGSSD